MYILNCTQWFNTLQDLGSKIDDKYMDWKLWIWLELGAQNWNVSLWGLDHATHRSSKISLPPPAPR